jgi:opacity protein-like surface antigen
MRKMIALILILSAAFAGNAAPAFAEEKPSNYLVLKGGLLALQKIKDLDSALDIEVDVDTDSGWGGQLALGHYFTSFLALEIEGGYFEVDNDRDNRRDLGDIDLQVIPVLATLKVLAPLGIIEPYIEGGGGAYFSRFDVKSDLLNASWTSGTETSYSLHAGGGLNINLGSAVFLGAEGRVIWTRPEWGEDDVQIEGYSATGVLGFRF